MSLFIDVGRSVSTAAGSNKVAQAGIPLLDISDFTFVEWSSDGGWGSVYKYVRNSDRKLFAMKFFGMVGCNAPDTESIEKEILDDWELSSLSCVPKLIGYLIDSPEGYAKDVPRLHPELMPYKPHLIHGKKHRRPYMVKVSECLEKDVMNVLIQDHVSFNQRSASTVFRNLIIALKELHDSHLIHCDLKPENFMFVQKITSATDLNNLGSHGLDIKLIDFGACKKLQEGLVEVVTPRSMVVAGTTGFFAPETLRRKVHSKATDVWQTGVCLWTMLFQSYPFKDSNDIMSYRDGGLRFPTNSASRISESCKDLFNRIFTVDPSRRITCEGILDHPWVRDYSSLPDDDFGEEYKASLKSWILRRKFKQTVANKVTRCNMIKTLFLDQILGESAQSFQITNDVFHKLQKDFLNTVDHDGRVAISLSRGIVLDEFCSILRSNEITQFAKEEVFRIFDLDGSGSIDYFEFLSVLAPYRENTDGDLNMQTCRLYFEMFDHDMSGEISREEFRAAVAQILIDYEELTIEDIESVFDTIDLDKSGQISLAEFKPFFEQMTRSISSSRPSGVPDESLSSLTLDP